MAFLNPFFNIKKTEKVEDESGISQKLDKGTLNRLKKATNLTEDSLIARHQEFNKMFPEKEGIVRPSEEFCKNPQILREKLCLKNIMLFPSESDGITCRR